MLGDKIRTARKSKHYTLVQLAEATELTASYISQLERNLTEPSISSLRKIATVLEIPMYAFLEEDYTRTFVVRKDKRSRLVFHSSGIEYEYISPQRAGSGEGLQMEMIELKIDPGKFTDEEYVRHSISDECLLVLEGELTVDCLDEKYILKSGDSIYIQKNTPHNVFNHTNKSARAVFCVTPKVF